MVKPTHNFYQSLNYNIVKRSGRNWVICNICKKFLHNTAISRLKSHRNVCQEIRAQENYNSDYATKHDSNNSNQLSDESFSNDVCDTEIQNVERLFDCESNESPGLGTLNTTKSSYNCIDETFRSGDTALSITSTAGVTRTSTPHSLIRDYEFQSSASSPDTTIQSANEPIFTQWRTTFTPKNKKYRKVKITSEPYDFEKYIDDQDLERKQSTELLKSIKSNEYKKLIKNDHSGMNVLKKSLQNNVKYVYWTNPNKLVERLRILHLSNSAGHSNHLNEIISIILELKKAGIIE